MDVEKAKELFLQNWWKEFNTQNPEKYDIHFGEVRDVYDTGVELLVAIVYNGEIPEKHEYRLYQVYKDGKCTTIIEGS